MAEITKENDLAATINSLSMGVVVIDAQMKVELLNPSFHKIWGTTTKQIRVGDPFSRLAEINRENGVLKIDDEHWENYLAARQAEIRAGNVKHREFEGADGKTILYSITNLSEHRRLICYFDLTTEKGRERALQNTKFDAERSRTQLTEAISALEDGFVFFDESDRLVICNDAFRAQFKGLEKIDELTQPGITYYDMTLEIAKSGIIPGVKGKEEEFVRGLVEKRKSELGLQKIFKAHDGRWIKQRDIPTESGGIVGLRVDVTALKRGEEELENTSDLLAASTKNMHQGLLVINNDKIQFLNNRTLELFDIAQQDPYEFIGKDFDEFLLSNAPKFGELEADEVVERVRTKIDRMEAYSVEHDMPSGRVVAVRGTPQDNGSYLYTYTDISEERAAQDRLIEREELLKSILTASENGLLVTNGFEDVVVTNAKALKLLGFADPDVEIPKTYRELLISQYNGNLYKLRADRKLDLATFMENAISATNRAMKEAQMLYMADGSIIRYRVRPLDQGLLVHSYVDITVEKKREEEILENQALMNTVLNASENAFLVTDEQEKIIEYNSLFYSIMSCKAEDLADCNNLDEIFELIHSKKLLKPLHKQDIPLSEFLAMARNIRIQGENDPQILYMVDGRYLRYRVRKLENGHTVHSYVDITEEKNRELETERARQKAEELAAIQAASSDAMVQGILFFQGGKLKYFNPKFIELVGVPIERIFPNMTTKEVLAVVADCGQYPSEEEKQAYMSRMLKNFDDKVSYNIVRHMKNGKILQVDGVARENGGLVISYSDVTESKNREAELQKARLEAESAERAKSEFLANMSHEIRTPMNGVMGMAELLTGTELDSKQKMFTDVIVKSGASLLTIINDILDFSKIDAGQLELDSAPFDIQEAMEDVATLVSAKVAEKDLEMIVRVDPKLPRKLVGDVGRFRQVITNLLGNAVKFTEVGHIYINLDFIQNTSDGVRFRCSVEDTGIGIPEDKLGSVFSKFSQADTSATRKHEGTGLGLSIASSLVKLMGGEIKVDSSESIGSTFHFEIELPIDETIQNRAMVIPNEIEGAKVLIIDDNEVNRSILTEQLASWRFDSASASTGQSGIDVMRAVVSANLSVDLVILDYQMPGMTGAEVLEVMRNDPDMCHIPVIMLTSVDGVQTSSRISELGIEASLTKPTRSSLLLETIMQVIANSRAKKTYGSVAQAAAKHVETPPVSEATDELKPDMKSSEGQLDILVAEDNEVNQIVFRQILEELDVSFKIVENGRLAVAAYQSMSPRMILMDVSMPEMNGKEATKAIRKHERLNDLARAPIVGVTAHALKGDMEACIEAGMDDYLSKPVAPSKLVRKVSQWLRFNSPEHKSA